MNKLRTVSIDLGGTRCRAAVVEKDGSIVNVIRRPTPVHEPDPRFLADMAREVTEGSSIEAEGVVVGMPGIVDNVRERLVVAPNLPPSWIPRLCEDWLADHMGLPVSMANDADLAAVGEAGFGAGRHHRDVVYVTISTGVGAGIVVGGKLVRGQHSGGEVGHIVIDRVAAEDGRPSTVEDLGSGTAIAAAAEAAGIVQRDAAFADLVRSGDPVATRIWNDAVEATGIGVAALAWMVVPSLVVVGGGVGRNGDLVLPILSRQLKRHGPLGVDPIELAVAELGDDAALAGGAAWWRAIDRQHE